MKEEIKKLKVYDIESSVRTPNNVYYDNIKTVGLDKVLEILDKHDNQPDFKDAWEELKKYPTDKLYKQYGQYAKYIRVGCKLMVDKMKKLEQKYNLGGDQIEI